MAQPRKLDKLFGNARLWSEEADRLLKELTFGAQRHFPHYSQSVDQVCGDAPLTTIVADERRRSSRSGTV